MAGLKCSDAPQKPFIGCQLAQAGSRSPSRDKKLQISTRTGHRARQAARLYGVRNDNKVMVLYRMKREPGQVPGTKAFAKFRVAAAEVGVIGPTVALNCQLASLH